MNLAKKPVKDIEWKLSEMEKKKKWTIKDFKLASQLEKHLAQRTIIPSKKQVKL